MASQPRTLKLPPDLDEAADILARQLGYGSRNALMKGLLRYACLVQGEHTLTLPWSKLPLPEQDKIDQHLLSLVKKGIGERGQLLRHVMERVSKGMTPEQALAEECA